MADDTKTKPNAAFHIKANDPIKQKYNDDDASDDDDDPASFIDPVSPRDKTNQNDKHYFGRAGKGENSKWIKQRVADDADIGDGEDNDVNEYGDEAEDPDEKILHEVPDDQV